MNKVIVTDMSQLPTIVGIENLYLDLETTSRDPRKTSLNPFKDCWVAGIAFTCDDLDTAWYVPVGHASGNNMPRHQVIRYFTDLMRESKRWVNHNVKYDMHCLKNDLGIDPPTEVRCTVISAKTLDSDRYYGGGYSLDALAKAWLKRGSEDGKQKASLAPYLVKNKDFGRIPIDVLGPYACQDAFIGRDLDLYIEARMPEECSLVHEIEQKMTLALYDMEQEGLRVDPLELKKEQLRGTAELMRLDAEISGIVGYDLNPSSSKNMHELFIEHFGMPVVQWKDDEGIVGQRGGAGGAGLTMNDRNKARQHTPMFDVTALNKYRPLFAERGLDTKLIDLLLKHRQISQYLSLYVESWLELKTQHADGSWRVHPQYNQAVKTFRMSCSTPNIQQADKAAWKLIKPGTGRAFVSMDMEQEELRIIAHYAKSGKAVKAYIEDPDVDYHQYVVDMCGGIIRTVAKAINFTMSYGGGKNRVMSTVLKWGFDEMCEMLKPELDSLIASGRIKEENRVKVRELMMRKRVEEIWETFNAALPEMKKIRDDTRDVFKARGFVRNLYGRRLAGPQNVAYMAFNKIIQGTAAEFFKDRTVAVSPRFSSVMKEKDAYPVASVHDSILFNMPVEAARDKEFLRWLRLEMCSVLRPMRIPLRASVSVGENNAGETYKNKAEEKRCVKWLGPYTTPYVPMEPEVIDKVLAREYTKPSIIVDK